MYHLFSLLTRELVQVIAQIQCGHKTGAGYSLPGLVLSNVIMWRRHPNELFKWQKYV